MRRSILLAVLAAAPAAAVASDMSGVVTVAALVFVIGPFALLNLVVTAALAARGTYASRRASLKHSLIASLGPALGCLLVVQDFSRPHQTSDRYIGLGIMSGLMLLAWLPMLIHRFQREWSPPTD